MQLSLKYCFTLLIIVVALLSVGCGKDRQKNIDYKSIPQSLSKDLKSNRIKFERIRKTENTISKLPSRLDTDITLVIINESGDNFGKLLENLSIEFSKKYPKVEVKIYSSEEAHRIHPNPFSMSNEEFNDYADLTINGANSIENWLYNNYIIPIEPLKIELSRFLPNAFSDVYSSSKIYGVPIFAHSFQLLYYNKDFVKSPPESLDKIRKTIKNDVGDNILTLSYPPSYPVYILPFLLDEKFRDASNIDDLLLSSNESISELHTFTQKENIYSEDYGFDVADSRFREGKSAYIINGDWSISPYLSTLGDKLGVSIVPPIKTGDVPPMFLSQVKYAFISSTIRNKPQRLKAVSLYLNFLTEDSSQAYIMKESTLTSPMKSLLRTYSKHKLTSDEKARIEAFSNTITYREESYKKTLFKLIEKYLIPVTKLEKPQLLKDMIYEEDIREFEQNLLGVSKEEEEVSTP